MAVTADEAGHRIHDLKRRKRRRSTILKTNTLTLLGLMSGLHPDARRGRRQIIARGHHHLHSWGMAVKALQDHKKLASTILRALVLLLRLNTSHEEAE